MVNKPRYFAEVGPDNEVLRVIAVSVFDCLDEQGVFSETIGEAFCRNHTKSVNRWLECSTDGSVRGRPCYGDDSFYEPALDMFVQSAPFPSWTLDSSGEWQPPVPQPASTSDTVYLWNEVTKSWQPHPRERSEQ